MKKTIITIAILGSSLGANAQATNTGTMEINAVIDAGCFLTANNINFGILQMPLSNQNASSEMTVKCSNNAPYQIKIGYGNTVSSGTSGTYTSQVTKNDISQGYTYQDVKLYKDNVPISSAFLDIECYGAYPNKVFFYTIEAAQIYGVNNTGWNDIPDVCTSNNTFNTSSLANLGGSSIGSLTGLYNGEQIAFEILNPSNQNWASNSYSANGNGLEQKIILKAQIKKENSPTHRLSADTYQSNVTVQLTY